MLKLLYYYFIIFIIVGTSILLPFFLSPSAVILTLIMLVIIVVFFLLNYGFIFMSVIYVIVYVGAVLILYVFAFSVLRERLYGFNFKFKLYLYFLPLYVILLLFVQFLILESFENFDFFSFDTSRIGINTGILSYDFIFYNLIFSKYFEISNISVLLFYKNVALFVCCGILLFTVLIGSISVLTNEK